MTRFTHTHRILTTLTALTLAHGAEPRARYVRIELPGEKRTLTLAEVEVVSLGANIAPRGKASQSSVEHGGLPARAIDGNRSGAWNGGGQTHTKVDETDPWFELDLGRMAPVAHIDIYNRVESDELIQRLRGFTLKLLDTDRKEVLSIPNLPAPREAIRVDFQRGLFAVSREGVRGEAIPLPKPGAPPAPNPPPAPAAKAPAPAFDFIEEDRELVADAFKPIRAHGARLDARKTAVVSNYLGRLDNLMEEAVKAKAYKAAQQIMEEKQGWELGAPRIFDPADASINRPLRTLRAQLDAALSQVVRQPWVERSRADAIRQSHALLEVVRLKTGRAGRFAAAEHIRGMQGELARDQLPRAWFPTEPGMGPPRLKVVVDGEAAGVPRRFPLPNGAALELVAIPAGRFTMGSPADEPGRRDNERQHRVTISRPFWIGRTEVTQAQWEAVMGTNPSAWKDPERPVESIVQDQAMAFCAKLNEILPQPSLVFRPPTEAEWEYAARAGSTNAYCHGPTLAPEQANFNRRHDGTQVVGQYDPNAWGLFDVEGNVKEICLDRCAAGPAYFAITDTFDGGELTDPLSVDGDHFVLRGGSWVSPAAVCRLSFRMPGKGANNNHGLRLVLGPPLR